MISAPPDWASYKEAPINGNWLKRWLKSRFRYVDYPFVLAYRGFGNGQKFILQGHVFRGMALTRPRRKYSAWRNFISLIKMFLVRTVPSARVKLILHREAYYVQTDENGFFEFDISDHQLKPGWYNMTVMLDERLVEGQEDVKLRAEVLIEDHFEFGLISDIDDTFLVSHVTRFWRKFYLLLTKNPESRKPFKGVVEFYRLLGHTGKESHKPFFYVSSSEWNLYDFLVRFCRFNNLPKGILQLKDIKNTLLDFLNGDNGNHQHKKVKIERLLEMYPRQEFILLGDNGQHDPYIYLSIAEAHPGRIKAIYIRAVRRSRNKKINKVLQKIQDMDIPNLQFRHSADAIDHARKHGFIK